MFAGESELFIRGGAGDHPRAHDLTELDCRKPGPAGSAKHGERLARLERGALAQRVERRAIGHGQAGGALEIELIGNFDQPFGADRDALPRRAPAAITNDAVTRPDIGDAAIDALDHSGKFRAGRKREWRLVLVFAGDDQGIEKIERDRLHGNDGLAWAGARRVDIVQFKRVRRTEMGAENGFHAPVAPR